MNSFRVTIVTPLDLKRRAKGLTERMTHLAEVSSKAGFDLVIGSTDRGISTNEPVKQLMRHHSQVTVIFEPEDSELPNLARLRNIAAQAASGEVLLFLDADIAPDIDLFQSLAQQVMQGSSLAMAPCIYLSEQGTRRHATGTPLNKIIQECLNFSPADVIHWALPSSVMAMRREDFLELGGFHEGYTGHGYEDFDFMLRFALRKQLLEPSPDLLIDRPYRAPLLAEGFRGALGALCLHNLLQDNIATHLFHDRDNTEDYYVGRTANALLFRECMTKLLVDLNASSSVSSVPLMVSAFYRECKLQGIAPTKFNALFDARPRHLLVKKPWFKRMERNVSRLFR
ncbi:hypothetical protein C5F52_04795 [Limnohabitans sp. TS-CS-82]|jgi:predicted glycosyltransferase involved in capsule biosynthesis|uniref:galactosyltransferase-related protein n=1 Tax=Limnohabitans sp. TS-CS-82 TaxID=2094193 RepID=UPI000CF1E0B3|nr:galactosyltransferase-related protein [Limnohabitans sp. TS-CS-82]PQA83789.1 hypothetical protein C5F52_04795 [Limnohabitans sp. TS-CS-82]